MNFSNGAANIARNVPKSQRYIKVRLELRYLAPICCIELMLAMCIRLVWSPI